MNPTWDNPPLLPLNVLSENKIIYNDGLSSGSSFNASFGYLSMYLIDLNVILKYGFLQCIFSYLKFLNPQGFPIPYVWSMHGDVELLKGLQKRLFLG